MTDDFDFSITDNFVTVITDTMDFSSINLGSQHGFRDPFLTSVEFPARTYTEIRKTRQAEIQAQYVFDENGQDATLWMTRISFDVNSVVALGKLE